ncbi:MAG TPA: ATPase domain-containing protein [Thermoplasmata archaeon]|nr:ATPase domain-containing protein [Thermoplasmata archaeon]
MASCVKKNPAAKPAGARPTAGRAARRVTVPTADDLDQVREDALLQLKIGRSAHYYSVMVSIALAVAAFLVLFLQPTLSSGDSGSIQSSFFLAFTLGAGVYLSAVALQIKWEAYQLWPWETHFWVTVLSVVWNVGLGIVYLLTTLHYGPTSTWPLIPWLYPPALLGVGLPLAGMALTWSEWSQRKTVSVACALLPALLSFVLYVPNVGPREVANGLAVSLFVAAFMFQTSGSFLHLISSGTRSHEREMINSGQTRLFQVADEVRQKEEQIRFREQRLVAREADVEAAEAGLRRKTEANDTARAQLAGIEQELALLSDELDKKQEEFASRAAETNTLARTLEDRESSIALKQKELEQERARLSAREQELTDRETDLRRQGLQVTQREQEIGRRVEAIPEAEARLDARKQDLDRKTSELFRYESQLKTREAMAAQPPSQRGQSNPRLQEVEQREAQLAQLKSTLDEQNLLLGRRAKQVEQDRAQIQTKESELAQREMALANRSSSVDQQEKGAKDTLATADQRRQQYEEALRRFETRVGVLDKREAEMSTRGGEMERMQKTLDMREAALKNAGDRLAQDRASLDRLQRSLIERQKEVESREEQVHARWTAVAEGTRTRPAVAGAAGPTLATMSPSEETLSPATNRRFADRIPTGTPRLDDLLLGGLPPSGHLLLVGDPFVGKEIVLYAYIAEGLKRGEDAVLITGSRGPDEIAQQMTEVLPTFADFEKRGRVRWIDASKAADSAVPAGSSSHRATVVNGPDDHAGILKSLVAQASSKGDGGGGRVRVGFLGLAASLAHSDEKAGFVFLQNFVGILKPRPATAVYSLEGGALTEAQVERLLSRMDGAIRFKQERDKTFLSVAGVGEVATRDWIECRATNKALIVGSFSLERIR